LAADILPHFKRDIEEMTLVPSDGGRFEIFVDGDQIFSKLETGRFPESREIVKAIEERADG
jgi:selenoprotein W-related protein